MSEFLAYATGAGGFLALIILFILIRATGTVEVAEPNRAIWTFEMVTLSLGFAFLVWNMARWIRR